MRGASILRLSGNHDDDWLTVTSVNELRLDKILFSITPNHLN